MRGEHTCLPGGL
ncbi:hypothetical protein NONO_c17060 [Nocardia nova SH22a]|uniref:Uncharacterized protein n=1 Tax=Nocardia nova SH22a TaxID=1415166 RepID=W5TBC9_9NOCA|nr:hypothetical protein NONO_c17060 [Nocardia nova SH22a]